VILRKPTMSRTFWSTLFLGVLFLNTVYAQDLNYTLSDDSLVNYYASMKRVYYATRTEIVPKIDGHLDDECWKTKVGW